MYARKSRRAVRLANLHHQAFLSAYDNDRYQKIPTAIVGIVLLGTPLRGTKWQPFLDSLAQLGGLRRSHRGITKELSFDEPILLDKLQKFCLLRNRLSTPVACFFELYETDYGQRFGLPGMARGMVRTMHLHCRLATNMTRLWKRHLLAFPVSTSMLSRPITSKSTNTPAQTTVHFSKLPTSSPRCVRLRPILSDVGIIVCALFPLNSLPD